MNAVGTGAVLALAVAQLLVGTLCVVMAADSPAMPGRERVSLACLGAFLVALAVVLGYSFGVTPAAVSGWATGWFRLLPD